MIQRTDADSLRSPPAPVKTASVRRVMEADMFVFTAKLNRRKAVLLLIVFALVIAAVILAVSLRGA